MRGGGAEGEYHDGDPLAAGARSGARPLNMVCVMQSRPLMHGACAQARHLWYHFSGVATQGVNGGVHMHGVQSTTLVELVVDRFKL